MTKRFINEAGFIVDTKKQKTMKTVDIVDMLNELNEGIEKAIGDELKNLTITSKISDCTHLVFDKEGRYNIEIERNGHLLAIVSVEQWVNLLNLGVQLGDAKSREFLLERHFGFIERRDDELKQ